DELDLVDAWALHVPARTEQPCPGAPVGPQVAREPFAAALDDVREVGQRLDVVDHSGLAVEALHSRERRLEPGLTAQAFEGIDERRLLAADVGARASVDDDVTVEIAAEDALADIPGLTGLLDAPLEEQALVVVLAADVDERDLDAQRVGSDERALDDRVRV